MILDKEAVFDDREIAYIEAIISKMLEKVKNMDAEKAFQYALEADDGLVSLVFRLSRNDANLKEIADRAINEVVNKQIATYASMLTKLSLYKNCKLQQE